VYINWSGDGSWNHATICVGYNAAGVPIVNCHNIDSWHRVWNYGSSSARYSTVQLVSEQEPDPEPPFVSLQTGRYGYSLTGKSIKGITGLSVEDWLDEVRGAEDAAEKSPEPEDVIRAYFSSYAAGDSVSAFERLSSRFMLEHVFSNLDENKLYNADFQPLPRGADAEVISIVEQANPEPDAVTGNKRLFCVKFNLELSANIASGYTEGMNERFFSMVRTLDKLGWKIDAIGTGF